MDGVQLPKARATSRRQFTFDALGYVLKHRQDIFFHF